MFESPEDKREILPDVPYKCEVVNPSLKKPGLRIFGPNSPEVYAFRLFEEGKLKKEDLKRFGFIVFEKHLPSHDIPGQYSFTPKNDMQFLHRDGYDYRSSNLSTHQSLMLEHGVIGFQTYSSLPIRKSYTAIMDRQHAMHDISLFALWNEKEEISHYSEAKSILEELRDEMRRVGIAHIDLKKYPRTIRSFTRLPQQEVVGLNRFLAERGGLYLHSYELSQFVLLDNVDMVHGRFETTELPQDASEPSFLIMQFYWDEQGKLIPCTLDR